MTAMLAVIAHVASNNFAAERKLALKRRQFKSEPSATPSSNSPNSSDAWLEARARACGRSAGDTGRSPKPAGSSSGRALRPTRFGAASLRRVAQQACGPLSWTGREHDGGQLARGARISRRRGPQSSWASAAAGRCARLLHLFCMMCQSSAGSEHERSLRNANPLATKPPARSAFCGRRTVDASSPTFAAIDESIWPQIARAFADCHGRRPIEWPPSTAELDASRLLRPFGRRNRRTLGLAARCVWRPDAVRTLGPTESRLATGATHCICT